MQELQEPREPQEDPYKKARKTRKLRQQQQKKKNGKTMHSVVIVTVSDSDSQATHCFQYLLRLWASSLKVIPG